MYKLIAKFGTHRFGVEPRDEVVARFTTREAAAEYVKAAQLKNGAPRFGASPYRAASLLKGADHAWIEEEEDVEVPVDPELGQRMTSTTSKR